MKTVRDSEWLAGAFSAWGIAGVVGARRRIKISLMTSSDALGYVETFQQKADLGRVEVFKGRWHWICDDPDEVKTFHLAVRPMLIEPKRKMIEVAWETWRNRMLDATDGEIDPGPIDGDPPDAV
jgi:hypothetical protein